MLATLVELQRLKNIDRTGWVLRGLPPRTESVAAHSFGVAIAAMMLADELRRRDVAVDSDRLLRMALLHDWAEARIGDMPKTAVEYFGAEARKHAELKAFADLTRDLADHGTSYRATYEEYEQRVSLEARLVKAADIIDLLVQVLALERAGCRGLDEFWEVTSDADFKLDSTANEVVAAVFAELVAARAKLINP